MTIETQTCYSCHKNLTPEYFWPSAWNNANPKWQKCMACHKLEREEWKSKDPEGYAAYNRKKKQLYKERYPEKYKAQRKRMKENFKKNFPEKYYANTIGSLIARRARRDKIPCKLKNFEIRDWFLKQGKKCEYCGSTLNQIKKYYKKINVYFADRRLQVDRKNNNLGYTYQNMTVCCRICNDHKSDFFSHKDFKIIAKKYIIKEIIKVINK